MTPDRNGHNLTVMPVAWEWYPRLNEIPREHEMKVFKFDPKAGTRGEQIDTRRLASWTDSRWNEYPYAKPRGFGTDAEVTVHRNAGTGLIGDEVSYRHANEWTCFCLGCWNCGPDTDTWVWVVLPPLTEEL